MKKEKCIYCGYEVEDNSLVPCYTDDEAWEELAEEHSLDCEWIATRAHNINLENYLV